METTTIDYLNSVDTELFYWINQHHCTVADYVLYAFTQHWSWMVMIVLFFAVAPEVVVCRVIGSLMEKICRKIVLPHRLRDSGFIHGRLPSFP